MQVAGRWRAHMHHVLCVLPAGAVEAGVTGGAEQEGRGGAQAQTGRSRHETPAAAEPCAGHARHAAPHQLS